jgi:TonB family protein
MEAQRTLDMFGTPPTRMSFRWPLPHMLAACVSLAPLGIAASRALADPAPPLLQDLGTPPRQDPAKLLKIGSQYYPPDSLRLGEQGRCVVKLQVDEHGDIHDPQVIESSGFPRLDAACLAAVEGGHLLPATHNGVPVAKEITIPIDWRLNQPASLADCMKAPNPLPVDPAAPSSKTTSSGKVILQIFVSPTGTVDGAIVWQSSGFPKLDEAGLKAVLHQKLTPATQDGQPVPACVKMPIVFKLDNE